MRMNKIRKTPAQLNCPIVLSEEFMTDKDILEIVQRSNNIVDADSNEENERKNAAPVPTYQNLKHNEKIAGIGQHRGKECPLWHPSRVGQKGTQSLSLKDVTVFRTQFLKSVIGGLYTEFYGDVGKEYTGLLNIENEYNGRMNHVTPYFALIENVDFVVRTPRSHESILPYFLCKGLMGVL
ncbi:hypothetical protein TNCV_3404931 [Trichonephila clavipes]|nr:hypothetical protein TNCV_3404931 [Trichonephila clavipes]